MCHVAAQSRNHPKKCEERVDAGQEAVSAGNKCHDEVCSSGQNSLILFLVSPGSGGRGIAVFVSFDNGRLRGAQPIENGTEETKGFRLDHGNSTAVLRSPERHFVLRRFLVL